MIQRMQKSRGQRIVFAAGLAAVGCAGAVYLYFHDPRLYPLPCIFYEVTGLYCPGCGAGRASYSILHGQFLDAFCYNPLMTILLPLIILYFIARFVDWVITGGNHIDSRLNQKVLLAVLIVVCVYGVLRNIPVFPFTLLAPGGLAGIL